MKKQNMSSAHSAAPRSCFGNDEYALQDDQALQELPRFDLRDCLGEQILGAGGEDHRHPQQRDVHVRLRSETPEGRAVRAPPGFGRRLSLFEQEEQRLR